MNNEQLSNQKNPISVILPTYKEMLVELGRQLALRKKIIFYRILAIAWPLLVMVILLFIWKTLIENKILTGESKWFIPWLVGLGVWLIFTLIYYAIISSVFAIEKRIWIDSFFDEKNLNSKTSWRIARKLFRAACGVVLQLIVRFYLLPFVVYFLFLALVSHFWPAVSRDDLTLVWIFFGVAAGGLMAVAVYVYLLRVKLRFVWFIFLDQYGRDGFSYGSLFQEMRKLNEVSRSEIFRKTLVINLGAGALFTIANSVIMLIQKGLSAFGPAGQLTGTLFRGAAEESAKQAISIGKIAAIYLLYRYARFTLYNEPQEINEHIYQL